MQKIIGALVFLVLLVGCAHSPRKLGPDTESVFKMTHPFSESPRRG
jgi:hypothetical protein